MDPNATLREIEALSAYDDTDDEIEMLIEGLTQWLAMDGFEPNWTDYPMATIIYQEAIAELTYA